MTGIANLRAIRVIAEFKGMVAFGSGLLKLISVFFCSVYGLMSYAIG